MAGEPNSKFLDQLMERLERLLIAQSDRQVDAMVKVLSRTIERQLEAAMHALARATNRKSDAIGGGLVALSEQLARLEREIAALREGRGSLLQ
jgi:ribosomal protein S9